MKVNLSRFKKTFIDTAPFIYFFEENEDFSEISKDIFKFYKEQNQVIVTSVLTVLEVLPKPLSENNRELVIRYIDSI